MPTLIAAIPADEMSFWERVAEKWGIGFIGLVLFLLLARWSIQREEGLAAERQKREQEAQDERNKLAARNNELAAQLLQQHKDHALRLEQIIKDGNKYQGDLGVQLMAIARKVNCPKANQHTETTQRDERSTQ